MFEKIMKVYAVNATVLMHATPTGKHTNQVSTDTNAGTAVDRIQQAYDFGLNMSDEDGGYKLDQGMVFTNGYHYVAYETYPGPVPDSVLILTSRCSDENLDEENSKFWVAKGIQEARKQADKILSK
ncbi:hypothetical protein [Vibrio parahaemolyticus]|uniref:hypothetical protein n=1 Tax=Vibrio parahaemolyticus TaxID=670 RepID=UPI0011233E91|nr:hypothetical protein [Vibrio parahaemolyticus]TOI58633.1 hypothetical protein CGI56_24700 [Vibrio parahaemolyticus]HCG7639766.1 hypothetical protein [Vibrio parahaemolyticus]